jgi:hypothetical protein
MRRVAVLALAWWFLSRGATGPFVPAGPFRHQAECEQMRAWVAGIAWGLPNPVSWCWWDGKG